MEIFKSNKEGDKVAFEGYIYITKHKGKNYFTWKCSNSPMVKNYYLNSLYNILILLF